MTGTISRVISECDISGLENGHLEFVALRGDTNNLLIGRCITVMEDEIEVSWFDGSYTTIWQPSKRKDPNNPRKHVDWTDRVPKSSITTYGKLISELAFDPKCVSVFVCVCVCVGGGSKAKALQAAARWNGASKK